MHPQIQKALPTIRQLLRNHRVEAAALFGSYARGNAGPDSDVDVLVRFHEGQDYETYADNYFSLLNELRTLLQKDVDLMAEETLRNPYLRQEIDLHKIALL